MALESVPFADGVQIANRFHQLGDWILRMVQALAELLYRPHVLLLLEQFKDFLG